MRVCGLLRNFEYWKGKQRTTCRKTAPGRELLGTQRQQTKSKGQNAEKGEVQGGGASVTYVRVFKKGS